MNEEIQKFIQKEEYNRLFSPDENTANREKAALFDEIAFRYYNGNFGSFSKSDMDLLMFSIYIDKTIDNKLGFDDYDLSNQLGILQSSVRQLKKKKQLIYPRNYNWREAFAKYAENAVPDKKGRVVISIPDPNVYIELQHHIEKNGGFVEVQLNPKLLKIPVGYFIDLMLTLEEINSQKDSNKTAFDKDNAENNIIKELNKKYYDTVGIEGNITKKNWKEHIKDYGLTAIGDIISSAIPPPYGTIIGCCAKFFSNLK